MSGLYTCSAQSRASTSSIATETDSSPKSRVAITSLVIASASRAFCCSDGPGQSLTMTCGIVDSPILSKRPPPGLLAVLLVADLLHPLDRLAVELLLDGDVRHRRRR